MSCSEWEKYTHRFQPIIQQAIDSELANVYSGTCEGCKTSNLCGLVEGMCGHCHIKKYKYALKRLEERNAELAKAREEAGGLRFYLSEIQKHEMRSDGSAIVANICKEALK